MKLTTPLGWIAISCFVIGLIIVVFADNYIEFTVKGKAWFILGIAAWGEVCIFLTVCSFLDYRRYSLLRTSATIIYKGHYV